VSEPDALKLTVYAGERDRAGGRFLADALADVYERHGAQVSAVFRGVAGFGAHHRLRTDRLLTLSEDLPVVSVAVDRRERVEAMVDEVRAITRRGLVTLERAHLVDGRDAPVASTAKLTVYAGRGERVAGRPAAEAVVALLHRHGVAGATVLLGVDGTLGGVRRRAGFARDNAGVPVMVISVGESDRIAAVLPELRSLLPHAPITLERAHVCRRDGHPVAGPQAPEGGWQKLMVFAGEQSRTPADAPLTGTLIRRLREAGAAGATALRGTWGYHGDHRPHGDRFWSLRRRVPVVTVVIDTPARICRWYEIVDELTGVTGLVTSEVVPVAFTGAGAG
jgi:PII-like signaling protein